MTRLLTGISLLAASMTAMAGKPCEELKAEIATGMTAHGFNAFQLEIVPTATVDTRTVVGTCDGGTKKILYSRAADAATIKVPAAPLASKTPPQAISSPATARPSPGATSSSTSQPKLSTPQPPVPQPPVPQAPPPKPIKRSELNGKRLFRDPLQVGDAGPEMIVIPAGTFTMGSELSGIDRRYRESPEHRVSIAGFALSRTEVTFDDFDRFVKATKRRIPDDDGKGRGTHPVVDVSWIDASEYAKWLTAQTGFTYRLPSEAEWEYAARAGGKAGAAFSTGDCITAKQANFNDSATGVFNNCPVSNVSLGKAQPVASYAPNAFGLYDMHGNVFEWVADCVHLTYEQAPADGHAWMEEGSGNCGEHMLRGGSWQSGQISLRSSLRAAIGYAEASGLIGFRIARELTPTQR